jgi:tRNA U34 5-carboxymethylaminomethyl modifying enzyme MnmG/GidA
MTVKTLFLNLTAAYVLIAVITPTPVLAETPRAEFRTERQEERQENRDERAEKHGKRLGIHCESLTNNMTSLLNRINTRITKQKADGKDVTAAETASAQAKIDIAAAKSLCDQAKAKFESVPTTEWSGQQPIVLEGRKLAQQAREAFMKARKDLVTAIQALLKNVTKPSPTPTASPTL